ncbi:MAG TPA: hypothetical protein VF987_09735, partial [Rhodospirillales bacterium]
RENNAAEAPSTSPEVCQRMAQNRAPWDAPRPNGEFLAALAGGGRETEIQHSPKTSENPPIFVYTNERP